MKPVDMKVSRKEAEKAMGTPAASPSGKTYPWGLEIRLDNAALKKLGIKDLPGVGAGCHITGIGEVTEVSERDGPGGKTCNLTIQIQKLALSTDEDNEKAFAKGYKGE